MCKIFRESICWVPKLILKLSIEILLGFSVIFFHLTFFEFFLWVVLERAAEDTFFCAAEDKMVQVLIDEF